MIHNDNAPSFYVLPCFCRFSNRWEVQQRICFNWKLEPWIFVGGCKQGERYYFSLEIHGVLSNHCKLLQCKTHKNLHFITGTAIQKLCFSIYTVRGINILLTLSYFKNFLELCRPKLPWLRPCPAPLWLTMQTWGIMAVLDCCCHASTLTRIKLCANNCWHGLNHRWISISCPSVNTQEQTLQSPHSACAPCWCK